MKRRVMRRNLEKILPDGREKYVLDSKVKRSAPLRILQFLPCELAAHSYYNIMNHLLECNAPSIFLQLWMHKRSITQFAV